MRVRACEAVLNRGVGLPAQAIDVVIQRLVAKKLVELNVDELRQVEAALGELAIDVTPSAAAETSSATDS